jgi:hypothetical protein
LTVDDALFEVIISSPLPRTHARTHTHTHMHARAHTHTHVQCTAPGQPRMFDLLLAHRLELSVSSRQPRQRRPENEQRLKEQQKQMLEARDVCMVCRHSDLVFVRDLRWMSTLCSDLSQLSRSPSSRSLPLPPLLSLALPLAAIKPIHRWPTIKHCARTATCRAAAAAVHECLSARVSSACMRVCVSSVCMHACVSVISV